MMPENDPYGDISPDEPEPESVPAVIFRPDVDAVVSEIHAEIATRAVPIFAESDLVVQSKMEADAAAARIRDNDAFVKEAERKFEPALEAARNAVQALRDLLDEAVSPVIEESKRLKAAWLVYNQRERERVEQHQRDQRRKLEEATRIATDAGLPPPAQIINVPPPVPKTEGLTVRRETVVDVISESELRDAIIDGHPQTSKEWLSIDFAKVRKAALAFGATCTIPGVQIGVRETAVRMGVRR